MVVGVRLQLSELTQLDAWIARQDDAVAAGSHPAAASEGTQE
jgi:hypothetical protein